MKNNDDIKAFRHFIEQYWQGLNGGGTFTLKELIVEYKKYERPDSIEGLLSEAKYLKDLLNKEDWEIDSSILKYILREGGKNHMKRIINSLIHDL